MIKKSHFTSRVFFILIPLFVACFNLPCEAQTSQEKELKAPDPSIQIPYRFSKGFLHIKDGMDTSIIIHSINIRDYSPFLEEGGKEKSSFGIKMFSKNEHLILTHQKFEDQGFNTETCFFVFDKNGKQVELAENCIFSDILYAGIFGEGRYLMYEFLGCTSIDCYYPDTIGIIIKDLRGDSLLIEPSFFGHNENNDSENIYVSADIDNDDVITLKVFDFKRKVIYEGGRHNMKIFEMYSTNEWGIKIRNRETGVMKDMLFSEAFESKKLK